jgi:hypothetical protein
MAAVPLLAACGCNLVGCAPGLQVHLRSLPVGAFRIELLVAGVVQPAPTSATCTGETECPQDFYFAAVDTDQLAIRVTTTAGTRVTDRPPVSYTTSYPNGRGCDPVCRRAVVIAELPI